MPGEPLISPYLAVSLVTRNRLPTLNQTLTRWHNRQWRSDEWSGEDPACIQYRLGDTVDHTATELGSALSIYGLNGPGLATTTSISIEKVDCAFVAQVVADARDVTLNPRTLYVRMNTPGDTGDNFGLYVRSRGARINPSTDPAPAQSWFEEADPFRSNPYAGDDPRFGQRPPCITGMCDGVYGNSLPDIAGSQYEARVPLLWSRPSQSCCAARGCVGLTHV